MSKMSSKNSFVCAIYGCKNKNQQKLRKDLFFYRFPKARDVVMKWVSACNRNELMDLLESHDTNYLYKKRYMVCSDHFEWKCFKSNSLSKRLIETAVPTKNLYPKRELITSCSENLVEIDEIEIKVEPQICHGCLSIDRRTSPLGHLNEIFYTMVGATTSNESPECFCWECMALLRRMERFKNQLKHAKNKLKQLFHDTQSLSKLTIFQKDYYDHELNHSDSILYDLHDHNDDLLHNEDDFQDNKVYIHQDHKNHLLDMKGNLLDHEVDLYKEVDLQDYKDDLLDHTDDLQDHKDDIRNIKNENLLNAEIEINYSSDLVDTEQKVISKNVDIDQDSYKSDRDVRITDSSTKINSKAMKRKLKSLTNIKKEYKSYAKHICHKNWQKPFTQYFTKVYLDEADVEMSFLKKDRKRKGCKMNLKCETCSLTYARKIDLDRHNNLNHHKPNTPYKCLHCNEPQPSLESLKEHWRSHSEFYTCNVCSCVVFPFSLALHLSRSHVNVYACTSCTLTFSSLVSFSEHYNKNHPFVCDYCNKKCALRSVLEKHIKNHHTPQICVTCDRHFDSYKLYRAHCREMHPDLLNIGAEPEMCYCVECDRQFPSRALYMKHINSKHTLKQWTPKRAPCPECGKVFNKNSDMLLHYNYSHVKVTKFHCDLCDKYFLKMYGLRIHKESVHLKLRKPKNKICDLCGRGFQNNTVLNNHRRTHTGERPFKCDVCPAAFAQKGAMKIHQRKQHNT